MAVFELVTGPWWSPRSGKCCSAQAFLPGRLIDERGELTFGKFVLESVPVVSPGPADMACGIGIYRIAVIFEVVAKVKQG